MPLNLKGLRRIPERGVIAGVCAGIAEYYDWNVKVLRVVAVILLICSGMSLVVYLALWYIMDPAPAPGVAGSAGAGGGVPGSPGDPATSSVRPRSMDEVKERFSQLEQRLVQMEECVTSKEFELRQELKKLEAQA